MPPRPYRDIDPMFWLVMRALWLRRVEYVVDILPSQPHVTVFRVRFVWEMFDRRGSASFLVGVRNGQLMGFPISLQQGRPRGPRT